MVLEKKLLSPADIEGQAALELPDRHTLELCGLFTVELFNNNEYYLFSFNSVNEAEQFCTFINSPNVNNGFQCVINQQSPTTTTPPISLF
jgi:hypothetical protein